MDRDPVAFAAARLDEAEAEHDEMHYDGCARCGPVVFPCDCGYPARVLREVEAGRRILARHQPDSYGCQYCADGGHNIISWGCADLADLLARWADHPDYDQAWRPADG